MLQCVYGDAMRASQSIQLVCLSMLIMGAWYLFNASFDVHVSRPVSLVEWAIQVRDGDDFCRCGETSDEPA